MAFLPHCFSSKNSEWEHNLMAWCTFRTMCHSLTSTKCGKVSPFIWVTLLFPIGDNLLQWWWRRGYLPLSEYSKHPFRLVTWTLEEKRNRNDRKRTTNTQSHLPHTQSFEQETRLACAGLLPAEFEFLMGTRRSRATFQPCWLDATSSPNSGIVPGSTFSFPTEIQGHQSLCWARGSNVFLWRSSS